MDEKERLERQWILVHTMDSLGLIVMDGARELGRLVDEWLRKSMEAPEDTSYIIDHTASRFGSGEGKVRINESVRGRDLFILTDVCNYSCTYTMRGVRVPMSPDDHIMDIKRMISAIGGKANRLCVIMPYLYGGRQHKRAGRESLDAALMLQELVTLGVANIITYDAHDPRVENAIPASGFDNLRPTYQIMKSMFLPGVMRDIRNTVVVSPDEGAMGRNLAYASALGLDVGTFYKQRDLSEVHNGRNPILKHDYMGADIAGRDVFINDDTLASGESLLSVARELHERGARDVVFSATFPLFTDGIGAFEDAYREGLFRRLISTNLTYRPDELLNAEWYVDTDLSKYLSYVIYSIHNDMSLNRLLNPAEKINEFLKENYDK